MDIVRQIINVLHQIIKDLHAIGGPQHLHALLGLPCLQRRTVWGGTIISEYLMSIFHVRGPESWNKLTFCEWQFPYLRYSPVFIMNFHMEFPAETCVLGNTLWMVSPYSNYPISSRLYFSPNCRQRRLGNFPNISRIIHLKTLPWSKLELYSSKCPDSDCRPSLTWLTLTQEHFSEDLNQLIVLERKGSSASWNSAKNEEYRDRWLGPGQSWESTVSAVMMIPVGM